MSFRGGAAVAASRTPAWRCSRTERAAEDCIVLALGATPRRARARPGLPMHGGAVVVDAAMRAPRRGAGPGRGRRRARAQPRRRPPSAVEHWGDALAHGEIAGRRTGRRRARWDEVPGFWSTIGERTLKYAAWDDGFDECVLDDHAGGAFTVWY